MAAAFAYINEKFLKLPPAIGLMAIALVFSSVLAAFGLINPAALENFQSFFISVDFSELLLGSMLNYMLFVGSLHVNLNELRQQRLSVILFSTISVVISTFIIGSLFFYVLPLFGLPVKFIYCLLFGSLISPTNPVVVLGILKEAGIPKSLGNENCRRISFQ